MSAVRIRFTRGHEVKFISHLDLMKVFERALRRSDLPISYSQGFNPHPLMVFGLPLSVGVTSDAEYADFELTGDIDPDHFMHTLNKELPEGIRITNARIKYSRNNIMASVNGALYEIKLFTNENIELEGLSQKIAALLQENEILAEKEGKGGIKKINIRPMIKKLDLASTDKIPAGYEEFVSAFTLKALLSAGSASNLKPELLVKAIGEKTGTDFETAIIHRRELYVEYEGSLAV